jgi:hypothetical protein
MKDRKMDSVQNCDCYAVFGHDSNPHYWIFIQSVEMNLLITWPSPLWALATLHSDMSRESTCIPGEERALPQALCARIPFALTNVSELLLPLSKRHTVVSSICLALRRHAKRHLKQRLIKHTEPSRGWIDKWKWRRGGAAGSLLVIAVRAVVGY